MLRELKIHNLVLIKDLYLQFGKGFSVITGETGAGKSILLSALKILQGDKAKLMIEDNSDFLKIEAVFDLPRNNPAVTTYLQEIEIEIDEELILERQVFKSGKNRCRINGSM